MYAIRSYYEPARPLDDWIRESKQHDDVSDQAKENRQVQVKATKETKARADSKKTIVITSYSIHYTKLYEWCRK